MTAPPISSNYTNYEEDDLTFPLDSEIAERMNQLRKTEKVCFLSGKERTYYPEDPGHSRFGLKNTTFGDPALPPPKLYTPRNMSRLNKPISKKGYGIGGLSGPRFHRDHRERNPAPNQYQLDDHAFLGKEHRFPPKVWINYGLLRPLTKRLPNERVNTKLTTLWNQCQQIRAPFGTSMKRPRFGKEQRWSVAGPGHYEIRKFGSPKTYVNNSFMRGPAILVPPTKLHCAYGPKESCIECGTELMKTEDYYRAKFRLKLHSRFSGQQGTLEEEDPNLNRSFSKNENDETPEKRKRVLLCRSCHCKALRGESQYWKRRSDVEWLFEKTRHCGYIHEHNGLPDFTQKSSCYWTNRLARKEAVLDRYWPDKCKKRIIMKKKKGAHE